MRAVMILSLVVLIAISMSSSAQWPEVTIQDIQHVVNPDEYNDHSPLEGDTVVVEGLVMGHARSLWAGARWSMMIADPDGGPWSGVQIIQHDTLAAGTGITAVQEGTVWKFTGLVEEFSYDPNLRAGTQVALLTNPPVPIQYIGITDIPDPEIVTCEDLSSIPTGEQWEEVLVKIENAVMVNNDIGSGQALMQDDTGYQLVIEDWYNSLRDSLYNGYYEWPPNGSQFSITGFVRDLLPATGYAIAPRSSGDIELFAVAPVFEDVVRDPVVPGSSDEVTVQATIYDPDGEVASAAILYSVDWAPFTPVPMVETRDSTYSGAIPAQADGSLVRFFLRAMDTQSNTAVWPDTTVFLALYHVLDDPLGIYHVQWTPYGDGGYGSHSPYDGYTVTVTGTVMHDPTPFAGSFYFIQDSDEPWHGLWVYDSVTMPEKGDIVEVTGEIEEQYFMTRIAPANPTADVQVLSTGNPVYDPVVVNTGDLATAAGLTAESYEDMMIRVENVVVATAFPDAPDNYGEFTVDDGSGEVRVDDVAVTYDGQLSSYYYEGMALLSLQGFQWYTYNNFKIEPRNNDDVVEGLAAMTLTMTLSSPSAATILWEPVLGATIYDIYRSTEAFFSAAGAPWMSIDSPSTETLFTDGIGDPATNYFFLGEARNSTQTSVESNIVGEFDFSADIPLGQSGSFSESR